MKKDFFVEISKDDYNRRLIIETLFQFTKKINQMSGDDLIAFYQALRMLKEVQPRHLFRKSLVLINITSTQLIVIQAMQRLASKSNTVELREHFNNVIGDDWIDGHRYVIF